MKKLIFQMIWSILSGVLLIGSIYYGLFKGDYAHATYMLVLGLIPYPESFK